MLSAKEKELLAAIEPRAEQEGVEIVTVEVVGAKKAPTIRVYLDTPDGVNFDVLAHSQAWINEIMDEIDPFPGAYMLEVSSPGIDRPLRTPEHFMRFIGEDVVVKTRSPIDNRSSFKGKLEGIDSSNNVAIELDDNRVLIPMENIKRAHVVGDVDFTG